MNLLIELSKQLKPYQEKKFLLAVSGGMDSMVLFSAFLHLRKNFNFQFAVTHFHHGPSKNDDLVEFRTKAKTFVESECFKNEVDFHCNWSEEESNFLEDFPKELKTEEEFRKARYDFFTSLMSRHDFDYLLLAHHKNDLLETRILRLLRGVGPDSLVAMEFVNGSLMRPLLVYSRDQLSKFAKQREIHWLEDPSNDCLDPMRNWIRKSWLKDLENKWPGSSDSLARSIDLLVHRPGTELNLTEYFDMSGLNLSALITLSLDDKKRVIANYMKSQGLKNYGQSHINEILKRLDTEQKNHTFRLLGRRWYVDTGRMSVEGLASIEPKPEC